MRPRRTRSLPAAATVPGRAVAGGLVLLILLLVGVIALIERFAPDAGSADRRAMAVADDSCETSVGGAAVSFVLSPAPLLGPPASHPSRGALAAPVAPALPPSAPAAERGPPAIAVA